MTDSLLSGARVADPIASIEIEKSKPWMPPSARSSALRACGRAVPPNRRFAPQGERVANIQWAAVDVDVDVNVNVDVNVDVDVDVNDSGHPAADQTAVHVLDHAHENDHVHASRTPGSWPHAHA